MAGNLFAPQNSQKKPGTEACDRNPVPWRWRWGASLGLAGQPAWTTWCIPYQWESLSQQNKTKPSVVVHMFHFRQRKEDVYEISLVYIVGSKTELFSWILSQGKTNKIARQMAPENIWGCPLTFIRMSSWVHMTTPPPFHFSIYTKDVCVCVCLLKHKEEVVAAGEEED